MILMNMNLLIQYWTFQWFNAQKHILKITEQKILKNLCILILTN